MNRRTFLVGLGATTVFRGQGHEKGGGEAEPSGLLLLSREGSGRATGYAEANKIVTVGLRTHLAWLDSPKTDSRFEYKPWIISSECGLRSMRSARPTTITGGPL